MLFDFAAQGNLGLTNWTLSWLTLALFISLGARLVIATATIRRAVCAAVLSTLLVGAFFLVPHDGVPRVKNGYVMSGESPRTLLLHDGTRTLRSVRTLLGERFVAPVRGVSRLPRDIDWAIVESVALLGDCREWDYLFEEIGIPVSCPDN